MNPNSSRGSVINNFTSSLKSSNSFSSTIQKSKGLNSNFQHFNKNNISFKNVQDKRPLMDKNFQYESNKKIIQFLLSNNYEHILPTEKLVSDLGQTDFIKIFTFLINIIRDDYEVEINKVEDDVLRILKEFQYPGQIKKSTLQAIGGPNSNGEIIGVLIWLVEYAEYLLNFTEKMIQKEDAMFNKCNNSNEISNFDKSGTNNTIFELDRIHVYIETMNKLEKGFLISSIEEEIKFKTVTTFINENEDLSSEDLYTSKFNYNALNDLVKIFKEKSEEKSKRIIELDFTEDELKKEIEKMNGTIKSLKEFDINIKKRENDYENIKANILNLEMKLSSFPNEVSAINNKIEEVKRLKNKLIEKEKTENEILKKQHLNVNQYNELCNTKKMKEMDLEVILDSNNSLLNALKRYKLDILSEIKKCHSINEEISLFLEKTYSTNIFTSLIIKVNNEFDCIFSQFDLLSEEINNEINNWKYSDKKSNKELSDHDVALLNMNMNAINSSMMELSKLLNTAENINISIISIFDNAQKIGSDLENKSLFDSDKNVELQTKKSEAYIEIQKISNILEEKDIYLKNINIEYDSLKTSIDSLLKYNSDEILKLKNEINENKTVLLNQENMLKENILINTKLSEEIELSKKNLRLNEEQAISNIKKAEEIVYSTIKSSLEFKDRIMNKLKGSKQKYQLLYENQKKFISEELELISSELGFDSIENFDK